MRKLAVLFLLIVGVAVASVVLGAEDEPPVVVDEVRGLYAMQGLVTRADSACALCHYGWYDVVNVVGTAEFDGEGTRYDLTVRPTSAYNLTDLRLVDPGGLAETTPVVVTLERQVTTTVLEPARGAFELRPGSGAVHLLVEPEYEYSRALLEARLRGPGGEAVVASRGIVSLYLGSDGELEPGEYVWDVRLVDGPRAEEALRVRYDVAPSHSLRAANATGLDPARFTFDASGEPRGLVLQLRVENHHPVDKWLMPSYGDHSLYTIYLEPVPRITNATQAEENGSRDPASRFTAAQIEAAWGGRDRITLGHERIDAVLVRTQDRHGEWLRRAHYLEAPGHEHAFPPVPPGTSHIEVTIEWGLRTPLSPAAEWYVGYASGNKAPTFYYPDATEVTGGGDAGRQRYVIPIDPVEWDSTPTGGFQAFALMRMEDGRATFDGWREVHVEAVRAPLAGSDPAPG